MTKNVVRVNKQEVRGDNEYLIDQEELQKEYDFHVCQMMVECLLDAGLITQEEAQKIADLSKKSMAPFLSDIMP